MDKEKRALIDIVDNFSGKKIAVWGDLILDEYLFGTTRRISREAPVLILSYQDKEYYLGGGGNPLLNLQDLGAEPVPIGVIGKDEAAEKIRCFLKEKGIRSQYIFEEEDYQTPIKTRIFAGEDNTRKQQILRIDKEGKVPDKSELKKKILDSLLEAVKFCCGLLISDYNYFSVREDLFFQALPFFKKARLPITLDSRFRLLRFKGVTAATPNEPEVEQALKIELHGNGDSLPRAGKEIMKRLESSALLITRGSRGMVLFERQKPPFSIPIYGTTDIVDVTGAGDTVISVFTLAIISGATFRQASLLANYAGGIVVMKKGCATVIPQELKKAIQS